MTDQHPATIGTVTDHDGTVYEVDWPPTIETDELPESQWDRVDHCVIYRDGRQVSDFINPDWDEIGFKDADHAMGLAHEYILSGDMRRRLEERRLRGYGGGLFRNHKEEV